MLKHNVYLYDFYMDQYEVTNSQYCQFLNVMGNQIQGGETWIDIDSENCGITRTDEGYVAKTGYIKIIRYCMSPGMELVPMQIGQISVCLRKQSGNMRHEAALMCEMYCSIRN